jgi:imidazolonepropionase-like amidohydrolase
VDRTARREGRASAGTRAEDLQLLAVEGVLSRDVPVVVHANGVAQMRQAMEWARRNDVRLILAGARDAWRIAPEIAAAGVPVVIGDVRAMPAHDHDPYDAPFAQPGILARAGVKIAFTVGDAAHVRNLVDEAAMALPFGLSREDAMRALTSWPAEMFGVSDRIGTLAEGRMGNVVTWSGDPLEITSRVERLFVRGEAVSLEDRQTRLYEKYRARPRPAPASEALPISGAARPKR